LKAVHHILVSSAETRRAFNSSFDTVNLHRPTVVHAGGGLDDVREDVREARGVAAQVEIESKV
jgi:hypothetical protein